MINKNKNTYQILLENYINNIKKIKSNGNISKLRLEIQFESLHDWSQKHNLTQVKNWFNKKRKKPLIKVKKIPLEDCKKWKFNKDKGFFFHESNEFFKVEGLRVQETRSREVDCWDQPILTQVGYDGGILGILRKRFNGVPHYLIEAKCEPGNYKYVQLSPTLQATFSNLRRAHRGRKPRFSKYFNVKNNKYKILFKSWLSEDGGRLNYKRNLGMLVEVPANHKISITKEYIWMSMWQIKECLKFNSWINPHIRGIISHF
ncbi:MAG: hypothetical protein CFH25_00739 [Alphaproteobacteria bacterium MarineAlpha6_Bin3]|nr:MAG: hypothetical protein CFH25_00739 [Alphaproteobacteria bacterium MarineAlpha6_Bin3]|tara:strand:- start:14061 stop:14840 length:780 start_codon:yes stop_codon:yes gene_type:complete